MQTYRTGGHMAQVGLAQSEGRRTLASVLHSSDKPGAQFTKKNLGKIPKIILSLS